MFSYAFAVMTAYNIVQPVTRSAFIDDLGAENFPYVLLVTGALIGFVMQPVWLRHVAAAEALGPADHAAGDDERVAALLLAVSRRYPLGVIGVLLLRSDSQHATF